MKRTTTLLINGEAYVLGNRAYNECPIAKYEIEEINSLLYLDCGLNPQRGTKYGDEVLEKLKSRPPKPTHDCRWCTGT